MQYTILEKNKIKKALLIKKNTTASKMWEVNSTKEIKNFL